MLVSAICQFRKGTPAVSIKNRLIKQAETNTHTPFNSPLSGTTWVSWYQKGKIIWILLKQEAVSGSGISWAVCKSVPCSRQITSPAPHLKAKTKKRGFMDCHDHHG